MGNMIFDMAISLDGQRLFAQRDMKQIKLENIKVVESLAVTHLQFRVVTQPH